MDAGRLRSCRRSPGDYFLGMIGDSSVARDVWHVVIDASSSSGSRRTPRFRRGLKSDRWGARMGANWPPIPFARRVVHAKGGTGVLLKYLMTKRRSGALASLVAAYALVLHVIISSFVLATVSPAGFAFGTEICISHPETGASDGATGKVPTKSIVRCPLCVGNHAPGVPPSEVVQTLIRFAIAVDVQAKLESVSYLEAAHSSHQARAPPRQS